MTTHPGPVVWVVGDPMLDVSVRADRLRRTPEDPYVPVLPTFAPNAPGSTAACGGAANVVANLAAMGCRAELLSPCGADAAGEMVRAGMAAVGGSGVARPGTRTTVKTRYYEGEKLVGRVDDDHDVDRAVLPADVADRPPPDVLVLTDYGRGALTRESVRSWAVWAKTAGVPVYGDPKAGRQALWDDSGISVMVANWDEALHCRAGAGPADSADDGWAKALASACRAAWGPFPAVVVKRGRHGSVWATADGSGYACDVVPVVGPTGVADVQGAGDTYLAGLVASRARGAGWADACLYASAAAGVAVHLPGTAVVSAAAVTAALRPLVGSPAGLVSQPDAAALAARLRVLGFRVGLTSGCLQLLHPGHVHTLTAGAAACDFLFAAVDSDARVAGLKGPGNPAVPAATRAEVVAAVAGVGAAFVFDESLARLVLAFRPAVLVKGGDWAAADVDGAEYLSQWGGRLLLVPPKPAEKTQALLARLRTLSA